MAQIIVLKQKPTVDKHAKLNIVIAVAAAVYACWAILGSGQQIVFYGTILLLSSVPAYIWVKSRYGNQAK
jgi:APA family basic amino acid/polyamine antiporter